MKVDPGLEVDQFKVHAAAMRAKVDAPGREAGLEKKSFRINPYFCIPPKNGK